MTGATGIVGSEIYTRLRQRPDLTVTGVSARGNAALGVVGWRMGQEAHPEPLAQPWDVVIHAAARTRWTMTSEEARQANLRSVEAVRELVSDEARLVHLSTAHVLGRTGSIGSADLDDYRNPYEWSKAAAERFVRAEFEEPIIVRFPIVLGRRSDGAIARFTGFHKLMRALASGLLPAIVAVPDAYLDVVPVDDIARRVEELAIGDGVPGTTVILGRGDRAPTVDRVLRLFFEALNEWRSGRGVQRLDRPPLLHPDRWDRFFLPFAREHLSKVQLQVIEVFSEFRPYMCLVEPFHVTDLVEDVDEVIVRTAQFWAEQNPAAASAIPRPWR